MLRVITDLRPRCRRPVALTWVVRKARRLGRKRIRAAESRCAQHQRFGMRYPRRSWAAVWRLHVRLSVNRDGVLRSRGRRFAAPIGAATWWSKCSMGGFTFERRRYRSLSAIHGRARAVPFSRPAPPGAQGTAWSHSASRASVSPAARARTSAARIAPSIRNTSARRYQVGGPPTAMSSTV